MNSGEATLDLIRLFVVLVGAAALVTLLARRVKLPYTVALVGFGLVAGAFARPLSVEITPQLVLVVLLPALIFEASYQTDFGKLRPSLGGVALLAGPGVFVSAALIAVALHFGAGLAGSEAFVVGAMLSATDPAAVIATFKRLGSPRRLATLVESESVFNDGTGIVIFAIAADFVTRPVGPLEIGVSFVSVVAFSAALGAVAGFVASRILPSVGDHLIEISLSVVLAYGTYLAADALHGSGVIATAVAGIVLGNYGRRLGLSKRTEEALDTVWEFVAFLATAFVFLVV
ncbi:MAG: cation:proton antiporter, partial [Candidatus Limnocylindrales bacterium]